MGLVFKMMIPIIMMLLIYGYMMGGQQLIDFMDKVPVKEKGVEGIGNAVTDEDVTVYQWVDEKGVKHYSNTKPVANNVEELKMSANANVIKAVKVPEEEAPPGGGSVTSVLKSPYSPGGAKAMMDDTTKLKNTLNQRMQQQQEMLEQISGNSGKK